MATIGELGSGTPSADGKMGAIGGNLLTTGLPSTPASLAAELAAMGVQPVATPGMAAIMFNDTSDWTVGSTTTGGSISLSTTYTKFSSQTIAVNSGTGTDGAKYVALTTANAQSMFTDGGKIGFWVYIPDYTKIDPTNGILVYAASDSGFTNYFLSTVYKPQYNGWHFVKLSRALSTLSGGQKWGSSGGTISHYDIIQYLRFRVYPAAGADSTNVAYFDSIFAGSAQAKPSIILTFDDGYQSWADDSLFSGGYKSPVSRMNELGLVGTFFTIPSVLGTGSRGTASSYATVSEISGIHAAGHEIGVHGENNLTLLADTAARAADIAANKSALKALGFSRGNDVYAYPNGAYNISNDGGNEIHTLMSNAGFAAARDSSAVIQYQNGEVGFMPYHIHIMGVSGTTDTYTIIRRKIQDALLAGGTCVLMFHVFLDVGGTVTTDIQCKIDLFYKILDYVAAMKNRGMVENVGLSAWAEKYA